MKLMLTIFLVVGFTMFFTSCETENSCDISSDDIYKAWIKEITDSEGVTFEAILTFNPNGTYDWVTVGEVPGHTDSHAGFTIDCDKITIINDTDCEVEGTYKIKIENLDHSRLTLTAITDECAPRKAALEGEWREVIGVD